MKSTLLSSFVLAFVAPLFSATEPTPSSDRALELLRHDGSVTVQTAGPHVGIGTFRVQVAAKLGQPDIKFSDGTWLYHDRKVEGSNATGTLVVVFKDGRVSSLSVVTPAIVAALEAGQRAPVAKEFVAVK